MDNRENILGRQEESNSISLASPTRVDISSRFTLLFSPSVSTVSLRGVSCTLDEYFEIPKDIDIVDYIDGKLELRPTAGANHVAIHVILVAIFNHRQADPSRSR